MTVCPMFDLRSLPRILSQTSTEHILSFEQQRQLHSTAVLPSTALTTARSASNPPAVPRGRGQGSQGRGRGNPTNSPSFQGPAISPQVNVAPAPSMASSAATSPYQLPATQPSSQLPFLTTSQYQQLLSLLNVDGTSTSANLSGMSCHSAFSSSSHWLIDSGASDHMTPHVSHLSNTISLQNAKPVRLPTGHTMPITHTGSL